MLKGIWKKGIGLGVACSLVLLIFTVLVPPVAAVKLSPGVPNDTSVVAGTAILFQNVNLTIRAAEAIPVNFLVFRVFNSTTHHEVGRVQFSLKGTEIYDVPVGAFTVINVTKTTNLPYQRKGNYYGYDERTGCNVTGFRHGFGYGYGYGSPDLTIAYSITYMTCTPGTYYAKLFVKSPKHTYTSGNSMLFTVLPKTPCKITISVDIIPECWPNRISPQSQEIVSVAICGNASFDVRSLDPKSIQLSLEGGKKGVKPFRWRYQDVAAPWLGVDGGGWNRDGDGYLDLVLKFKNPQEVHVLNLFKHLGETLQLTITGTLKNTCHRVSVEGHDYVQIIQVCKGKK